MIITDQGTSMKYNLSSRSGYIYLIKLRYRNKVKLGFKTKLHKFLSQVEDDKSIEVLEVFRSNSENIDKLHILLRNTGKHYKNNLYPEDRQTEILKYFNTMFD